MKMIKPNFIYEDNNFLESFKRWGINEAWHEDNLAYIRPKSIVEKLLEDKLEVPEWDW
jgi:hypothetical protein